MPRSPISEKQYKKNAVAEPAWQQYIGVHGSSQKKYARLKIGAVSREVEFIHVIPESYFSTNVQQNYGILLCTFVFENVD